MLSTSADLNVCFPRRRQHTTKYPTSRCAIIYATRLKTELLRRNGLCSVELGRWDSSISVLPTAYAEITNRTNTRGWLGSRVVSVLDSGVEGPGFKSQPRRCRVTVLGWLPRTGISSGTLRSVIEYGLPLHFYTLLTVSVFHLFCDPEALAAEPIRQTRQ